MRLKRTRRTLALFCLAIVPVIAMPAPVHAVVAATVPGSFTAGYATPTVFTRKGGPVTLVNGDVAPHTLTAMNAFLPRRIARKTKRCAGRLTSCPLFTTKIVDSGESGDVSGLGRVKPGAQYAFRCQIHSTMRGTLIVSP